MASNPKTLVSVSVTGTAGECPQKLSLSGSVPIRAPPTLDDDDSEFDVSSNVALSDAGFDSDDFQTASPLVTDPESDYVSQEEVDFEVGERAPLVHVQLSPMHAAPSRVMPFAHLSSYDDDDDDHDEMLSVVRVQDNVVGAPREENAEGLMFMDSLHVSQSLLANELTFFNGIISDNFVEAENDIAIISTDKDLVVEEHGLDQVLGNKVAYDEYSFVTDIDVMSLNSQDKLNDEQFSKVRMVLNELEVEKDDVKLCGVDRNEGIMVKLTEADTVVQRKLEVATRKNTDMVEGTSIMVGDTSLLKSNAEDYKDSLMPEHNTSVNYPQEQNSQMHSMTSEPLSDAFAENIEYSTTTQWTSANGKEGFASDQESGCENLVSITKSVMNSKTKLHDTSAGFESNDDACEGNKIQRVESSELFNPTLLQECTYLENGLSKTILGVSQEDELFCDNHSHENVERLNYGDTAKKEATVDLNTVSQESNRDSSTSDGDVEGLMSVGLEQFREQISALSILLGSKGSRKNSQEEQIVRSSHGKMNLPKDDAKSQSIYVDTAGELDANTVTFTSADESSVIFNKDPASFSSIPDCDAQAGFKHNISEKEKEKIQKVQTVSVKFLRLVQRMNLSLEDSLVSKVLCRLVADIRRRSNQEFVIKSANILAKRLEEDCQDDLDFSLNILVLGRSGVGKSATINSIFGDMKVVTNAFEPATTSVKEVFGTIDGVKIRILDTPGLRSPLKEQAFNRKIFSSIKRYMNKFPLDVILYVDRVDAQTRDLNDLPILRSITNSLSPSIWQHTILTLTHAASAPFDGPSGSPLSYEVFVAQKSYLVQQSITQAVGDMCQLSSSFMCPVSLVENHPLCGKNICGDCVLPNGLRWRSQLLALCFSLKILSEVSSVSGPQTLFDHWKHFFFQDHSRPMCHLFSSLLQSPPHLKFSSNWN
ncbi:translocase of chloroplast 159, chloroplastic-like [Gastrolobium bilobum]|uniref:translocase of chloroplast 159, chloroplastic-like n=1 Tax=Gastrolobium bilobum TaxID=150636 RepID=UPI002AAFDE82|nr:translocase of chloroplast 159, chloroplastic-like [Gastrolobium bilobum]